ncbi:IS3 family transposase [Listeria booriae]|uniref:IS3 family transposase n=1 Tax=Listeria booriae TaxID=1552123 RepID=A0A841Y9S8_9LIST|nr:IS3 family transposase [Listeria booriae]
MGTLAALKSKIDYYMLYYNNYRYQRNIKKMAPVQSIQKPSFGKDLILFYKHP